MEVFESATVNSLDEAVPSLRPIYRAVSEDYARDRPTRVRVFHRWIARPYNRGVYLTSKCKQMIGFGIVLSP